VNEIVAAKPTACVRNDRLVATVTEFSTTRIRSTQKLCRARLTLRGQALRITNRAIRRLHRPEPINPVEATQPFHVGGARPETCPTVVRDREAATSTDLSRLAAMPRKDIRDPPIGIHPRTAVSVRGVTMRPLIETSAAILDRTPTTAVEFDFAAIPEIIAIIQLRAVAVTLGIDIQERTRL